LELESVLVDSAAELDEDPLPLSLAEVVIVSVDDVCTPKDEPGREVALTTELTVVCIMLLGAAESDSIEDGELETLVSAARAIEERRSVVRILVRILVCMLMVGYLVGIQ
jgi:hypothetical protein